MSELATAGSIALSNGELWVGGNNVWGEWFAGLIDEVRVYNRALTAAEITTDMNRSVGVPDTEDPTAPTNLQKTGSTAASISLSWTASTDNVGVAGYRVFRGTTEVGTTAGTTFTIPSLSCGSSHDISVEAYDFANNASTRATLTATTSDCDTTLPTVAVTAPTAGSTVSGTTVNVTATASDNDAVAGVQFMVDGATLGAEDTAAPYAVVWDTWNNVNGPHSLTRGRGTPPATRPPRPASTSPCRTPAAAAARARRLLRLRRGAGTVAADSTTSGNHGTLVGGPAWTIGRFGQALNFDGTNDRVSILGSATLD